MAAIVQPARTQIQDDMSLFLRYAGAAVDDGSMDVYRASASMVAFSDYVIIAARQIFGPDAQVQAKVTTFRPGSFITDLLFQVLGAAGTLWTIQPDIPGLIAILKESLGLFKFLKGEPPKAIEHNEDNRTVTVTNTNGNTTVVQIESLNVTFNDKAGKAAEAFMAKPLEELGIDSVSISSVNDSLISATKNDAGNFRALVPVETLTDVEVSIALTIETASFDQNKKWRLWDGSTSITASIEDPQFLAAIDRGEPFRKGDTLICKMRISQTRAGSTLKLERAIIKVEKHIQAFGDQTDLFKM